MAQPVPNSCRRLAAFQFPAKISLKTAVGLNSTENTWVAEGEDLLDVRHNPCAKETPLKYNKQYQRNCDSMSVTAATRQGGQLVVLAMLQLQPRTHLLRASSVNAVWPISDSTGGACSDSHSAPK